MSYSKTFLNYNRMIFVIYCHYCDIEQTGWITSQCEKRERMRRSLEEDKSQLQKLRKKVEHLQEELTRDKRLLQSSRPRHERSLPTEPSVVAVRVTHSVDYFFQ